MSKIKSQEEFLEELKSDPQRLKEWLRKIMGPSRRELAGEEHERVWTLLQMLEPYRVTNNQRFITEKFQLGAKYYNVTHGIYDYPVIEEVEIDELEE